jgi:zinc transporter 9
MAVSMFLVTFTVGYLPTKMGAAPHVMNLISIFGAGLLVGAALIIIVPEGMSVLYQSMMTVPPGDSLEDLFTNSPQTNLEERRELLNRYVGASLIFGFTVMLLID